MRLPEKKIIQDMLEKHMSVSEIAEKLNRNRITIYTEIRKNSINGNYNAEKSEELVLARYARVATQKRYPIKPLKERIEELEKWVSHLIALVAK
jgi:IS30 family transposase